MIPHFLQLLRRNSKNNVFTSLTNIISITIGMSAFILVMLWVNYELSFDKFNEKKDNIYRVICKGQIFENEVNDATSGNVLSKTLPDAFPQVEDATAMFDFGTAMMNKPNGEGFRMKVAGSRPSFFKLFSIPLIKGDFKSLDRPNTAFITQSAAKRIFGEDNPIGKILSTGMDHEDKRFTITGVMADIPANSHFTFDFLFSLSSLSFYRNATDDWMNSNIHTYLLLDKKVDHRLFENELNEYLQIKVEPILKRWRNLSINEWKSKGESFRFVLQPLSKIHLHSSLKNEFGQNGNIAYVRMALIIGLFILIISVINFTNLSIVQSISRSKEVMVKKVVGASRQSIIFQFILESCAYSFCALVLSLIFIHLFLPLFEKNTGILILSETAITSEMYLGLVIFSIITGVIAGLYPAFVISKMSPLKALAEKHTKKLTGKLMLKDALLIMQFSISILVIISTLVVSRQLDFLQNKKLGFKKENIVIIRQTDDMSRTQQKVFKESLLKISNIQSASFSHRIPGLSLPNRSFAIVEKGEVKLLMFEVCPVEASFFETYNIELVKGDYFSDEVNGKNKKIVLNEETVKAYNIKDPIGKKIYYTETDYYEITGIVKDFHFNSKRKEIRPTAFVKEPDHEMFWPPEYLSVGVTGTNNLKLIAQLKSEYENIVPGKEFVYSFFDDDYNALYKNEYQAKQLFSIFALISISLSCLGLFSIVKHIAISRIKEIGIRKVSGARTSDILIMLSGNYFKMVVIAFVIASPIAYYAMTKWLENFAYKTELRWWIFALAGILALGITILTVSWQSWRAARRNPVESLRYE